MNQLPMTTKASSPQMAQRVPTAQTFPLAAPTREYGSEGPTLADPGIECENGLLGSALALVDQAVTASLAGLDTHPRTVADQLHRAIDAASARHFAEVGNHSMDAARANEAFSTVLDATDEALRYSERPDHMIEAMRAALDMTEPEKVRYCGQRRHGFDQDSGFPLPGHEEEAAQGTLLRLPCVSAEGHADEHRDALGRTWARS